eukprot:scaffold212949_cov42-Prasinocladus_malaysianus.AAC.3
MQRTGGFYQADCVPNPIHPDERCAAYASEAERFNRDFAREEYEKRVAKKIQEEERLARKRTEEYNRDKARWDMMDRGYEEETQRQTGCTARPIHKNNRGGEPVHPITMRYIDSDAGQELKYHDDHMKWRGECRRDTLWRKQQSQEHNIITGAPVRNPVMVPEKPQMDSYRLTAPWDR